MYYNLYLFIIILGILSPINAYNREKILQKISIQNEVIIISTGLVTLFIIYQLFTNNKILPEKIDSVTVKYLSFNIGLTFISLFLGGMIIKNSNILKFKAIQKPIYLILLVIIACIFYEKTCNIQTIFGIGLLVIGCILIDKNLK
jgi:uncharacterized membrane protein